MEQDEHEQKPRINETGGPIKFVQLYIKGEPYLRIGDEIMLCHSEILENVLNEFSLEFETETSIAGDLIPKRGGSNYTSTGMGKGKASKNKVTLLRNSKSTDYELTLDEAHLDQLREYLPNDLEITVA